MADGTRKPKGLLITGIVLLVLSLVGCGAGAVGVFSFGAQIVDSISNASDTPLGETTSFDGTGGTALVAATAVSVVCEGQDSSGNAVSFSDFSGGVTTTFDVNGRQYEGLTTFDTVDGERYDITCSESGSGFGNDLSARYVVFPLPGSFGGVLAGIGGILGGGIFFLLGLVFLIAGLVARSRWKKRTGGGMPTYPAAPTGAVPPPPGGGVPPPPVGAVPPPPGGFQPHVPGPAPAAPPPPPATPPGLGQSPPPPPPPPPSA